MRHLYFSFSNTAKLSLIAVATGLILAGCASKPAKSSRPSGARVEKDAAPAPPPADVANVPDAQPKVEPIAAGGPNKPYEVLGQTYTPQPADQPLIERGIASWYGKKFHGRRTANGEVYNMYAMTAAHKTMPLPSYAVVRNPRNGREVVVRVNDRGPFHAKRVIDLSYSAAMKLGITNGIAPVELERLTHAQIRTGSWRKKVVPPPAAVAATLPQEAEPITPVQEVAPEPTAPEATAVLTEPSARKGIWLQLGVFKQREGAQEFQRKVSMEADWLAPLLAVFSESEAATYRLQAGPYANRSESLSALERIRETLRLVPVVVQRQ
jgi:rare lipoprotein A